MNQRKENKESSWQNLMLSHMRSLFIYIYIYILIDDYYNQEIFKKKSQSIIINVTFYWKIFLNHIRDKNKFKIRTLYFLWFNVLRLLFVTFFIQCFKITICFIWFNVSRLFLFLTHKKTLFAFQFLLLYIHMLTALGFMPSHLKYTKSILIKGCKNFSI